MIDKERMLNRYTTKAEIERKNFDLTEKKIKIKENEKRATSKEIAVVSLEIIGKGLKEFLYDKTMLMRFIFGLTGAYVIGYGCKKSLNLIYDSLNTRLMTPKLVRETSRIPFNQFYKYPFKFYKNYLTSSSLKQKEVMKGIVLNPELDAQLKIISNAVINRKKHIAPFRNLLFYGPPGTGKTLFAKQLAKMSGLDFAILTGADVAPLGHLAVHEIHKIFDWAEVNTNGINKFLYI
jgi:ATPase family AAA domain-containing protein 3A/B